MHVVDGTRCKPAEMPGLHSVIPLLAQKKGQSGLRGSSILKMFNKEFVVSHSSVIVCNGNLHKVVRHSFMPVDLSYAIGTERVVHM